MQIWEVFASFSVRYDARTEYRYSFGPDAVAQQGKTAVWKSIIIILKQSVNSPNRGKTAPRRGRRQGWVVGLTHRKVLEQGRGQDVNVTLHSQ